MVTETIYSLEKIDANWTAVDQATLLFVLQEQRVLLIRKKRGLGAGKINGPGGKLEPGESFEACALRELHEELGIRAHYPKSSGRLRFQFVDDYSIDVQVYIAHQFDGEPIETDEAIPLWFAIAAIPYDEMWEDDRIWLPEVLAGKRVDGKFIFDGDRMIDQEVAFSPA